MKKILVLLFFIAIIFYNYKYDNYYSNIFERARYNYQMNNMVMASIMLKQLSHSDNIEAQGLLSTLYQSHADFNVNEHDIDAIYWCAQSHRPNFIVILLGKYDLNEYNSCAFDIAQSYLYSQLLESNIVYLRETDPAIKWLKIVADDNNESLQATLRKCKTHDSIILKSCICRELNAESWNSAIKCQ